MVFCVVFGHAQKTYKDSIDIYFDQIQNLISLKDNYKEDFLDPEFLLDKKDKVTGREKVATLLKLYSAYVYKSSETARTYNQRALELSKDIGLKQGELCGTFNEAYLLFVSGQFDEAMDLVQGISKYVSVRNYPETYADVYTLISYIHTEKGEFDMALETGLGLLDVAEKSANEYLLMRAYSALSHYYLRIENYPEALSYCLKGLHYVIRLRKVQYIFPKIDEIARMTAKLDDTQGALDAYSFYVDLEKKINPPGSYIQSIVYMNMADIFISNGKYEKAQNYLSQALEMNYKNKFRFRIPRALMLQAELNLKNKDTVNAILNYEESIEAAEDINAFDVVKTNSGILAELYEKTNQPSMAYEHRALNKVIRDSLFNNEKEQKIVILETRRKVKEITQKKRILELENEAQRARYNTIMIVLGLVVISGFFAVLSYLKVRAKNKLLYKRTMELAEIQVGMGEKLRQLEAAQSQTNDSDIDEDDAKLKSTNTLDNDVKNIILRRLEKLEMEKFFIDQNCSLRQVAQQLKTNPKYLSQVVNQEKKSSFTNYINELRINYLLSRLLQDEDFRNSKLSYIAASIGYNNLNTFNTAFKKKQGILPSYFIKELIQDQN
ncbi:Tetratricopeptide repeat-containing protein [Flagellimonas pacifica]|uniref:Tetratricopeptide repeat-containing protein n=2 Tax=Flagellimonas pacifica TaxID=1247520 RepID=A0A285MJ18_9FLAO|nr:Tetratricopeptide repeat-containing protein [Allomuricauda parva]